MRHHVVQARSKRVRRHSGAEGADVSAQQVHGDRIAMRTTLEANGWRSVSSTSTADHGITQVYEKSGSSLEVHLIDGWWYTVVELTASRAQQQATK